MSFDLKAYLVDKPSLATDSQGQPISQDIATVVALAMMDIASIDNCFDPNEINLILKTLARALELSDEQAGHTLAVADYLQKQNKNYAQFSEKLVSRMTKNQIETLLGIVIGLASADRNLSNSEHQEIIKFAKLLNLEENTVLKLLSNL